jgi:uncharacterized protein (TIGR00730 family)
MANINSICVYCGSSVGDDPAFVDSARAFGKILAKEKIRLVYGGGTFGLMGAVAQAAAENGGEVVGIIPDFLIAREMAFKGASEMIITEDMHERKHKMFERADAFVTLPGGIGTLEEIIEQLSWAQLGRHKKPVLILNVNGFWNPLLDLFAHQTEHSFIRDGSFTLLATDQVENILPLLRAAVRDLPQEELSGPAPRIVAEEM